MKFPRSRQRRIDSLPGAAPPTTVPTASPAYSGDFPDPFILPPSANADTYWAYSTGSAGRNLQVMSSSNLTVWQPTDLRDPLPVLPSWASVGNTWSPAVLVRDRTYLMYYAVRHSASGRQCISVATASRPDGEYVDDSAQPLICQLDRGGSIDPAPFIASDGTAYLLWKSDDNALRRRTSLWTQQLTRDGRALIGRPTRILTQDAAWQAPAIEGPSMFSTGGRYYLFYGANRWDSARAAIGYAVCSSPTGPCTNVSTTGPWMASHGSAIGPSGPSLFTGTDGLVYIAYHAWTGGVRSLWIDTVTFPGRVPTVT